MITTPRMLIAAAVVAVVSVGAELLLIDSETVHEPFPYGAVPGLWLAFGLVWSMVLLAGSKWLGHTFLMRHHDPYEHEDAEHQGAEHDTWKEGHHG